MFLIGQPFVRRTAILDHLDEWIGEAKAMIAARGPDRRRQLRICAPATGWAKQPRAHHSRNDSDRRWVRRKCAFAPYESRSPSFRGARQREPGIHSATSSAVKWIPGSTLEPVIGRAFARPGGVAPE